MKITNLKSVDETSIYMKIVKITLIGLLFGLFVVSCKEAVRKKFEFIGLEFGVKF